MRRKLDCQQAPGAPSKLSLGWLQWMKKEAAASTADRDG